MNQSEIVAKLATELHKYTISTISKERLHLAIVEWLLDNELRIVPHGEMSRVECER